MVAMGVTEDAASTVAEGAAPTVGDAGRARTGDAEGGVPEPASRITVTASQVVRPIGRRRWSLGLMARGPRPGWSEGLPGG